MKININILSIILSFGLIACDTSEKKENKKTDSLLSSNLIKDTISDKKIYNVELQEKEIYTSMYNNKYLLKVIPDTTSSKENMNYTILMTLKSDTIINYTINMDSITKNYYKYNKTGLENKKIDFKKDYYLSGIEIEENWARAENLYLGATLNSKIDTTKIDVLLKFKYIGKQMGEVMFNVY